MKTGEYQITRNYGKFGHYVKVVLHVEILPTYGVTVQFDHRKANEWHSAVRFGIEYAFEHCDQRKVPGIEVQVGEVHSMMNDTSTMLVAYASMRALWMALKHTPVPTPIFDERSSIFTFPK